MTARQAIKRSSKNGKGTEIPRRNWKFTEHILEVLQPLRLTLIESDVKKAENQSDLERKYPVGQNPQKGLSESDDRVTAGQLDS